MAVHQHIVPIASAHNVQMFPLACPQGIAPAVWRRALRRRIDEHLLAVEGLLFALDGLSVDPELEEDGTEQDIAAPEGWRPVLAPFFGSEDDEPDADGEPSLGWARAEPWERQTLIATERDLGDREAVNEDGGDILDGPHDMAFGGGTYVPEGSGSGAL